MTIKKITVLPNGVITFRSVGFVDFSEGGTQKVEINYVMTPGEEIDEKKFPSKWARDIAELIWTPEVIEEYKATENQMP